MHLPPGKAEGVLLTFYKIEKKVLIQEWARFLSDYRSPAEAGMENQPIIARAGSTPSHYLIRSIRLPALSVRPVDLHILIDEQDHDCRLSVAMDFGDGNFLDPVLDRAAQSTFFAFLLQFAERVVQHSLQD